MCKSVMKQIISHQLLYNLLPYTESNFLHSINIHDTIKQLLFYILIYTLFCNVFTNRKGYNWFILALGETTHQHWKIGLGEELHVIYISNCFFAKKTGDNVSNFYPKFFVHAEVAIIGFQLLIVKQGWRDEINQNKLV